MVLAQSDEQEERMLEKAMAEARKQLETANQEERGQYEARLAELEQQPEDAECRVQRALSMAQQTKRGPVDIISNIGSFGESVFKIGMTRRLEPLDPVKELGDASIPFSFDVYAMIYSEDAPAIEKALHRQFAYEAGFLFMPLARGAFTSDYQPSVFPRAADAPQ